MQASRCAPHLIYTTHTHNIIIIYLDMHKSQCCSSHLWGYMSCNSSFMMHKKGHCPRMQQKQTKLIMHMWLWMSLYYKFTYKFSKAVLYYMSIKKPPSERHFTSVLVDSLLRNLLHWKKVAEPPAESPDKIAYT